MKKYISKVFPLFLALLVVVPMAFSTPAYAMHSTSKETIWQNPDNHKGFSESATYINSYSEVIEEYYSNTYRLEITNLDGTIEKVYPDGKNFYRTVIKNPPDHPSWISETYFYIDRMYTRTYTLPDREDPKIVDETIGDFVIGNGKISLTNQYGNDVDTFFTHILKKYIGKGGNVVIPDGIEVINDNVFSNPKDITNVSIPSSVQYIEDGAFGGTGLTSVVIPSSVKRIQGFAFAGCANLTNVIICGNPKCSIGIFDSHNPNLVVYSDSAHVNFYSSYDGFNLKPLGQATTAKGSLTLDTTSYSVATKANYEIGTKLSGYGGTLKVNSDNSNTAKVVKLSNGNYRITGVKAGTAYIMFNVYNKSNKQIAHASMKVVVQNGIKSNGSAKRQTATF